MAQAKKKTTRPARSRRWRKRVELDPNNAQAKAQLETDSEGTSKRSSEVMRRPSAIAVPARRVGTLACSRSRRSRRLPKKESRRVRDDDVARGEGGARRRQDDGAVLHRRHRAARTAERERRPHADGARDRRRRSRCKLGNAIAMPVLPYTPNNASADLPGTIGLTPEILGADARARSPSRRSSPASRT